jgi:CHAT domain-containing protein
MRCFKVALACLMAASSAVVGGAPAAVSASRAPSSSASGVGATPVQTPGAASERDEGRALLHRGRAAEALVHLERALGAFHASGDRSGEASTRDLLGELYERQGRYDTALENYTAAFDLYAAGAAKADSDASKSPGRLPDAAGAKAAKAANAASKGASVASALTAEESGYNAQLMLSKMGNMLYRGGDLARALSAYERLDAKKPDTSALGKAKRTSGLFGGAVGAALGRDKPTIRIGAPTLGTLLTVKNELGMYRQTIIYSGRELGLGRVEFKAQKYDDARKHFEAVLDATKADLPFLGKLGQTRRYRTAARTSLGDVALYQGRYDDAEKFYKDAAKGAKDDGRLDLMWPAQRGIGRSLWLRALTEKDPKKAVKRGDEAVASYTQALDTVETILEGSLRADESRTTFLATTKDVYDEAAGALAEMAIATASNSAPGAQGGAASTQPLEGRALEYATEALAVAERGRARSLLDMLGESGGEITEGVPADLREKKRENLRQQQEIAALLTGVSLGGDQSKDKLEEAENKLGALQSAYESIENEIRTRSPQYAALTSPSPLTLEDVRQKVLDDQTALLEYSLGDERSYLFALTRSALTVSRLPGREEIERRVSDLRQQIIPSSLRRSLTDLVASVANDPTRGMKLGAPPQASPETVGAYAQAANALYKSVVEPAAPLFKGDRLLIVADGALNYVPFHALVTAAPTAGADFSTLPYLLKTNETLFAPSASVVAAMRQQQQRRAPEAASKGDMLLVADPVFDASDSRARVSRPAPATQPDAQFTQAGLSFDSALADFSNASGDGAATATTSRKGVLVRLAGTHEEAQQIAKLASSAGRKADVWLDMDASEANVEGRDLSGYRVVHFATHGLLNAERPQFTGLVLSLVGNREGDDGFLRTDEVFNLHLGSPLVMLSACETGLGREKRGEGVMGLTRAFMYAGAPTVGVTLWSVADKSTADLMTDFYKSYLGAQASPSAAMSAARLRMIEGKRYSTPFYWAPFVLVGDWK